MENWIEIRVTVDVSDLERTSAIVSVTVPYGIYIEDYSNLEAEAWEIANIDLIDEALLQKDRTKGIVHIYIAEDANPMEAVSFIEGRLQAEKIAYTLELVNCKKEDWENNWKQYFKPVKVGKKLLIHPVWIHDYDAGDRKVLHLEPGIAFGTGTHETTRLCMEALESCITPETVMLDVGCGSGILSVAGMLLGAKSVVGVDIDPLAVKVAKENGAMNGFSEPEFTMLQGDLTDRISSLYSVVTANIVADAIISLTPQIKRFLLPQAVYIVSGIIDTRAQEVSAVLSENGFRITDRYEDGGWVCMKATL
jgi:ribosomal protein L11 methyltransferase